jgi:hypothetical protein
MKMNIRAMVVAGCLLVATACTNLRPDAESAATEWLPTIGVPASVDAYHRQELLKRCGVKDAEHIWIRTLDLDRDNQEDCVVTIALPEEIGPYWRNRRSVTYVFRGGNVGAFGLRWENATLWFSLVTYEGQDHVRYGDSETIRQFSIFRRRGTWCVRIRESEYGNEGGEASQRLMKYRRSKSWTIHADEMPRAAPEYP